jgi:hypothetical protein
VREERKIRCGKKGDAIYSGRNEGYRTVMAGGGCDGFGVRFQSGFREGDFRRGRARPKEGCLLSLINLLTNLLTQVPVVPSLETCTEGGLSLGWTGLGMPKRSSMSPKGD